MHLCVQYTSLKDKIKMISLNHTEALLELSKSAHLNPLLTNALQDDSVKSVFLGSYLGSG